MLCPRRPGSTVALTQCVRPVRAGSSTSVQPSDREEIRDLLKRTAVALKQGDVPFALCGGYAAWVRGAPEPDHDADFLVPEAEAERTAKVLAAAGPRGRGAAGGRLREGGGGGGVRRGPVGP